MRLDTLLGEAYRDVRSGTARAALFAVILGLVLSGGAVLAAWDQIRALDSAAAYRASGASVTVLRAPGRIDGSACDAFTALTGVRASGAIRSDPNDLVASTLPDSPIPAKDVTPGFATVIGASSPFSAGILLADQVARSLAAQVDDDLVTPSGTAPIAGVFEFPDDGRQGDLGFSALIPQVRDDREPYDECWVDTWPQNPEVTVLTRTAILPSAGVADREDDERPTVAQLNGRLGSRFAGADGLATGSSRFASGGTATAGFALGIVSIRRRRLELASALHAGISRSAQTLGHLVQTLVWTAAGVLLSMPVLAALVRHSGPSASRVLADTALQPVLAGALAVLAGAGITVLLTKERHLFRHFKER
jgi:hypothetical protein